MAQRERRLVFGEVAELYDAHRPSYPQALVADLAGWAADGVQAPRALEVGAGTGKATRLVAARGVSVVAIEPSAEMAGVLRRSLTDAGAAVEVVESDFESAQLGGRRFPLVYAAQAWHWVSQPAGYARARLALLDGGRLVAFWNRPAWRESAIRAALQDAYARTVPDLIADDPMHPGVRGDLDADAEADWAGEIAAVDGFTAPELRGCEWAQPYTATQYAGLLATLSAIRLLEPERRGRLLSAVEDAIDAQGGSFELPMHVRVCVARAGPPG